MTLVIERIASSHQSAGFSCGVAALDTYVQRYALQNDAAGAARIYVAHAGTAEVIGYYALAVGSLEPAIAPPRIVKGLARHPVPVAVLARLAVSRSWQGRGLGAGLLKDAILRVLQAADIIGIRALVVHAKDEAAGSFYSRFGLVPFPNEPLHFYRLLSDIRGKRTN